jgi:hypothetical protein
MKRTCRIVARQVFLSVLFITAAVAPLYGQQPGSQSASQTSEERRGDVVAAGTSPSAKATAVDQDTTQTKRTGTQPYVFPTHHERFKRFVNSTVGPVTLGRTAISAGINQWRDHPEEWEQGASGYGKRFASSFGKNVIHQTVTYGLDEAMGLDTGFKRSTRHGFGPRLKDALLENLTSRNRKGERVFSVPRFAGTYTATIIRAETWYPDRYDYKDGLRSGTTSILTGFLYNVLREFVIHR